MLHSLNIHPKFLKSMNKGSFRALQHYIHFITSSQTHFLQNSGVPRNFFGGVSKNSVGARGRENGDLRGLSPLVRGSAQVANELHPYY
jgi:hypothetical protein